MNKLRVLDFDDMVIISLIGEGLKQRQIAELMNTNAPTISQRVKKYDGIWDGMLERTRCSVSLSPKYRETVNKITKATLTLIGAPQNMKCSTFIASISDRNKVMTSKQLRKAKSLSGGRGVCHGV